jgi:hypothetical protein
MAAVHFVLLASLTERFPGDSPPDVPTASPGATGWPDRAKPPELYPFHQPGKRGYMNRAGEVVIPARSTTPAE